MHRSTVFYRSPIDLPSKSWAPLNYFAPSATRAALRPWIGTQAGFAHAKECRAYQNSRTLSFLFIFKAVLTSEKHRATCLRPDSCMRSSQQVYVSQIGFTTIQRVTITDPARRVAVGGSLTAHKSVEPPAQPPHRCLSNAVYCWMTHVFSSFFLCAIYIYCYQTALVFQQMPGSHWQQVPPS